MVISNCRSARLGVYMARGAATLLPYQRLLGYASSWYNVNGVRRLEKKLFRRAEESHVV